jgi:hypothetical protein
LAGSISPARSAAQRDQDSRGEGILATTFERRSSVLDQEQLVGG